MRRIQAESVVHATVETTAPPIILVRLASDEAEAYQGYRRRPPSEITHASGKFFPSSLPELLPRFLAGEMLHEPFEAFS